MINEIVITAKFVTGTTIQDSEQAKKETKRIFLDILAQESIYPDHGIFSVEILKVKAEKI